MFDEKFFDEGGKSSLDGHAPGFVADGFVGHRIAPEKAACFNRCVNAQAVSPVKAAVKPVSNDARLFR